MVVGRTERDLNQRRIVARDWGIAAGATLDEASGTGSAARPAQLPRRERPAATAAQYRADAEQLAGCSEGAAMTHAADRHRALDRAFSQAFGDPPGHALMRARDRMKVNLLRPTPACACCCSRSRSAPSERTGRPWYSAWLGKARLVGFEDAEPNERGHRTIKFYAETPTPKPGADAALRRAQRCRP